MSTPADRRGTRRHSIGGRIRWEGGEGITRNVSTSGMYLVTDKAPQLGQWLDVALALPGEHLELCGRALVVRLQPEGDGRYGVAVTIPARLTICGIGATSAP